MGYVRILWIRESPVRRYLAEHGETVELAEEIGRAILGTSAEDGYCGPLQGEMAQDRPLFDEPAVVCPVRSFHSSAFGILVWTGSRLVVVEQNSLEGFDTLESIARQLGDAHVLKAESLDVLSDRRGDSFDSGPPVIASVWRVNQDFSRAFNCHQTDEWPVRELGASVLWQLRRQEVVSRDVGTLEVPSRSKFAWKAFDIISPEFALFSWHYDLLRTGHLDRSERNDLLSAIQTGRAWLRPCDVYPDGGYPPDAWAQAQRSGFRAG